MDTCSFTYVLIVLVGLTGTLAQTNCPTRTPQKNRDRACKKRCDRNGNCESHLRVCVCDGECGKSCIRKNLACSPNPTDSSIPNGRVEVMPYNKFSAIARYICDHGYELEGVKARVCQGNGLWSNSLPTCVVSSSPNTRRQTSCGTPPHINNAHHDGEVLGSYESGIMLQYSCDLGFTPNKGSIHSAWCVGPSGFWVGPNMTCTNAGCPINSTTLAHGRVVIPKIRTAGSVLRYTCNNGYNLTGHPQRTCQADGAWSGREPSCESVVCNPPPTIPNARLENIEDVNSRFASGQQVRYECKSGYEPQGDSRIMCNIDGLWKGANLIECKPVNCGFPGQLSNGWRSGYSFSFNSTVSYYCEEGYELTGQNDRTCQTDGSWSGFLPQCVAVECPAVRAPLNGRILGSGNAFGTLLEFECTGGFMLYGSVERRCQSNKTWSGEVVTCDRVKCRRPTNFWNGYILDDTRDIYVGETIYFSCSVRTNFFGAKLDARCMPNGQWSNGVPTCLGECEIPRIPDADIMDLKIGFWYKHGTVMEFRCKDGLVPDVTNRVTCNNGTWSDNPSCIPSPCPTQPPHVDNGIRIFEGVRHNSRARYICRGGYRLRGMASESPFLTCKYGSWIGGRPVCEEFYCVNPGKLENGNVYKMGVGIKFIFAPYITTIRHGDRLLYTCKEGFRRKGPSGATCVNGQWRPNLGNTKCERAMHAPFPKLWRPLEEINQDV